jgi:glycosyltransferase involved in cell wall biosynthesis
VKSALVVSRFFPFDAQRVHAVYQRLGTQVEALARVAERVDCLFLVPRQQTCTPAQLQAHEERLRALWTPSLHLHLAPTLREDEPDSVWERLVRGAFDFQAQPIARPARSRATLDAVSVALAARPALVLAHRLSSMCVLMRLRRLLRGTPLFFDMDDIEHVSSLRRLLRHPGWPLERLMLLQVPRLLLAEIQAMRQATATFVCSEPDRDYLARFVGRGRVQVVANSVKFPDASAPTAPSEPLVLFVGSLGYRPNAQAADLLVRGIWPLVISQVPEARLAIIGTRPELAESFPAGDPSVTFTGFVDDLDGWYRRARLVCCPIRYGAGTRVKIIEAAAHARAIVSTHLGAEGLNFVDGREIVLRDTNSALGDACVALLRDRSAAERLGVQARERARATYDRSALVERLARIFAASAADAHSAAARAAAAAK